MILKNCCLKFLGDVKIMLTFNVKKEWFEKIKSGEKTHEYRERTDYWYRRLFYYWYKTEYKEFFDDKETICFACGYPKKDDKDLSGIYNRIAKEGAKLNIGLLMVSIPI